MMRDEYVATTESREAVLPDSTAITNRMKCERFLKYTNYSLMVAGCERISKESNLFSLHKVWSYFSQIYFVSFCISTTAGLIDLGNIEDEKKRNENITLLIAMLPLLFKLALSYTKRIRNLMTQINEFESRFDRFDREILQVYNRNASYNLKIFLLYAILDTVTILIYFFNAVFEWIRMNHEDRRNSDHLIYLGWFPYNPDEYFDLTFLFQSTAPLLSAVYSICFDSLFITFMNFATARLDIIGYKLNHLGSYSISRNESTSTCLGTILMEHQSVIEYIENLNNSLQLYFLLDSLVKSLQISSLLIILIHTSQTDILFRVFCLLYVILQVSSFYYHASKISSKGTHLCDDIFESDWYDQSAEVKRSQLILMTRVQKPLVLSIGNIRDINNGLIIQILKACYTLVLSCLQLGV